MQITKQIDVTIDIDNDGKSMCDGDCSFLYLSPTGALVPHCLLFEDFPTNNKIINMKRCQHCIDRFGGLV